MRLLGTLCFWIGFAFVMLMFPILCRPSTSPIADVAPRLVHKAHQYHGITASFMEDTGERYFIRNGKKCVLFTDAFMKEVSR